ncbi:hypothetical protein NM688_g7537 [Phlebia brevispora]|uniref:Uncharacterized protein n=1 Tax=Phlebia brevispora TaxID=194682 RepID=A0ACC1S484_9APHY|nr:hypothetical protein NM688_g7537 [Phlebia brevispora]
MDNQTLPLLNTSTVEFFSYRRTYDYPCNNTGGSPQISSDVPLTPISDPLARLTREYSAFRLRLATAERQARPQSIYSQRSNQADGIFAPPSSARTPPALGLNLGVPAETRSVRTSSIYASSSLSVSNTTQPPTRIDTSVPKPNPQAKAGTRPSQHNQRSPSRRKSGHQFNQNQGRRKQPPSSPQQQRKPPQASDPNKHSHMKPAERCKQLEKTLREVQDLLQHDRKIMRDREALRARERSLERQREQEREQERQKEL